MKKSLLFLAVALTVSFAACNKTEKASDNQEAAPQTEVVELQTNTETEVITEEPAAPTKTPEEILKGFEQFINEYAEANNNKVKDIKKYQELAKQSGEWAKEVNSIRGELDKKQTERLNKALENLTKINTPK